MLAATHASKEAEKSYESVKGGCIWDLNFMPMEQ
jgi:hypothetical protein